MTMQQLTESMTAQEFAQHHALERHEPMPQVQQLAVGAVLAALANGPLKPPEADRLWAASDFAPELWQALAEPAEKPADKPMTLDDILARARLVGMVQ